MQYQKIVRPCKPSKLNYVVYKELRNISAKSFLEISRGCRKKLECFKGSRMIFFSRGVLNPVSYLSTSNDYFNGFCLFNRKNYPFFVPLPNSSDFLQAGILYNVFPLHLHFFSVSFLVSII